MNLVIRKDMTVDSRTIAAGCGIEHESAIRLLSQHRAAIEELLGILRFEIGKIEGRGRPEKIAILTEDQATALITMFRNTPVVVRFKVALAKAFGEAKRRQQRPPSYGELARMALELESKLGIAGDIFHMVLPATPYGETGHNGQPRLGIRRAAFVAAKNRINEAARLLQLSAQLELQLLNDK